MKPFPCSNGGRVCHDPFGLMPPDLPSHPRVLATTEDIERTKGLAKKEDWASVAVKRLTDSADEPFKIPDTLPSPADYRLNAELMTHTTENALAHLLTDEDRFLQRALAAMRLMAKHYPQWPITNIDFRAGGGSLSESRMNVMIAQTYDLLAAAGLDEKDDALLRGLVEATKEVNDSSCHGTCGNHSTWRLVAKLSISLALGEPQGIHDALYGYDSSGRRLYGLVHQLRHDILSDGCHWERAPGYHFYTLMAMTEFAQLMANAGADIWHARLPSLEEDDGEDLHRAYGPPGTTRCLKAMYDAPFYQMFADGNFSLLHDSGLANIRGAHIWGVVYELAYEAYGDPKYAWLLNLIDKEYADHEDHKHPKLPMSLHASRGKLDFVRLKRVSFPEENFSLKEDCEISLTGRHTDGCTIFPVAGNATLRSDPTNESAPGVYLFWGPHSAGHQNPAALHIDMNCGRRITDAPRSTGYEDPTHLTWHRTTIAHNTVTVDERSMFPYDFETESIWEADSWRDRDSDGVLEFFEPSGPMKSIRIRNDSVYPGVRLDRTLILTRDYVVDVFRALSDEEHQYDWASHCIGSLSLPANAAPTDLGQARGYRHLTNCREIPFGKDMVRLLWEAQEGSTIADIVVPDRARIIVAAQPDKKEAHMLAESEPYEPRTTAIVRAKAKKSVFISLWQWGTGETSMRAEQAAPDGDVVVTMEGPSGTECVRLPMDKPEIIRES